MNRRLPTVISGLLMSGCAQLDAGSLADQVEATERAFARTMAERDFEAFQAYLSEEAVFLGGGDPLRGAKAVAGEWSRYFESAQAPFSWEPATVQVLESGELALSTGPVRDPSGKQIATFTSIWRQDAPGVWRIVFDRGTRHCE